MSILENKDWQRHIAAPDRPKKQREPKPVVEAPCYGSIDWLRREGNRLVEKGQALLAKADNLELEVALGEKQEPSRSGSTSGVTDLARDMAENGWVSALALAEKAGVNIRNAASCLSRLAANGELDKRKQPGYPAEYRRIGV